jgi:large subunit ribosomal protein L3
VWKGKHLPGQYGHDNVTVQNLTVMGIEADKNILLVSGAVPGHADGLLFVNTAVKGQKRVVEKKAEPEKKKK